MPTHPQGRRPSCQRRRLSLEQLEQRLAPANLKLDSIELVDGQNTLITAPVVGQQVYIRAKWTNTGLVASNQYVVRYTTDGVNFDTAAFTGADGSFTDVRATAFAAEGPHSVTVKVDGTNLVAETDEADNTLSLGYTPVAPGTLPEKLLFPVAGTANKDFSVLNYVDIDPRTGQRKDFHNGPFQVDGGDGMDVVPANFAAQDAGVPVVASAGGKVIEVTDGLFDRETVAPNNSPNYVAIDHGNGWVTRYESLAANSITVKVGDIVKKGQLLGLVGSSGQSDRSHLHWKVTYKDAVVEPNLSPNDYWDAIPTYQADAPPTVLASGITNYLPDAEFKEEPSRVTAFPTGQNWDLYYFYHVSNYRQGAQVEVVWYRPDGSTFRTDTESPTTQQPSARSWNFGTNWQKAVGTWAVALRVDNVEIDRQRFTVFTNGAAEPEVSIKQGSAYLIDERVTPYDFGSVGTGGTPVKRTFTISNLGSAILLLANRPLPTGFSYVGSFPQTVPAGGTATFEVQLDSSTPGLKFGELNVATNDTDEGIHTFLIKGLVTGSLPAGTPAVTLPGAAVATGFGKAPVVIDPNASVTDSDVTGTGWNGASLRVSILTNGFLNDRLAIRNQGTQAGQVGLIGSTITFGGVAVGTFSGGDGVAPLDIAFGPNNATKTAVDAVLRNLTYANVSTTPDTRPRFLGFRFTDSDGKASDLKVKRVTSTPKPINTAPVLTPALVGNLPPLDEDQVPVGTAVSALTAGAITDEDLLQSLGIAVTGTTGSFGAWQYSLNGGTTWLALGAVSASQARLLDPSALLRFVPQANEFGTASITFRAWDGTQGTAGGTFDLTGVVGGGITAFSTASATSNVVVNPVNDPPTFTLGPDLEIIENTPLQSIVWATAVSAGPANENQTVQFLLTVADPSLFVVQPTLSPAGVLQLQAAPGALGATTITVQLQDSAGATSPAVTRQVEVITLNDAPVMTPFTKAIPDTTAFTVADLLGDNVTDPDDGAVEGVAITAVSRTGGDWQYRLAGSATWQTLSNASLKTARLLRATDSLRFKADNPLSGFGELRFRAWDQTRGTAGGTANLSAPTATGGKAAYSVAESTATIFLGKGVLGLLEDPDPAAIGGGGVTQLLRGDVLDADLGAVQGVAIVGGTQGPEGRWEYQSMAGTGAWVPMGPLTPSAALLLRQTDNIRFVPAANWNGFFSITFHAWDQTSGVPGGAADLAAPGTTGGATSFSTEVLSYTDLVESVNDAPTLAPGNVLLTPVAVGAVNPPGDPVSRLLGGRSADVDTNAVVGLAVVSADGPGAWQFSTDGGATWQGLGPVSEVAPRVLGATARLRFVPGPSYTNTSQATIAYRATDGVDFSAVLGTASVTSNTAPTLDTTPLVTLGPVRPVSVAALLGTAVTDPDPGAVQGLAVVGTSGTGSWQYSLNGGGLWRPLVLVNNASARLFRPGDLIRYLPYRGALDGKLLYRAWDQTRGAAGLLDDTAAPGVTAYSGGVETASVNAAPVLNPLLVKQFPTRVEGAGPGLGLQVRQLLANSVTDNGVVAPRGIAIAAASTPPGGKWEFSLDGGATWQDLGPVSGAGARLLRLFDRVRFVAPADFAGTVSITYHAWDQSNGTAGGLAGLAAVGGSSPFSLRSAASRLAILNTNDRPALDPSVPAFLSPIAPGQVTEGDPVSSLLGGASDADPGTALGAAIVATSGNGSWQFSLNNGVTWQAVGAVSGGTALLLRSGDRLRFVPSPAFIGVAEVTFRAWDRTSGSFGAKFNTFSPSFSAAQGKATVAVNRAPTLTTVPDTDPNTPPKPELPMIDEDTINPAGAMVESLLVGAVADPDPGAVVGIAVVGVTGPGAWQFSLDNQATWSDMGVPSASAARLLRGTDWLRFVPAANFNGWATISYRAWDQTFGQAGGVTSAKVVGGSTPFSAASEVASVTVRAVNDRPVLTPTVATVLTPVRPGTPNPPPLAVAAMLAGIVSDPDGPTPFGVAITGQDNSQGGVWQYSTDGGLNWQAMGTQSANAALLLRSTDLIRFVPTPTFAGTATLTYAAWDRTKGGKAGDSNVNTLDSTLADAFSLTTNVAYLPVNTAPTLKG